MLTFCALVTMALSLWGTFEVACDLVASKPIRFATRCGDWAWLIACLCMFTTAAHSLSATWLS